MAQNRCGTQHSSGHKNGQSAGKRSAGAMCQLSLIQDVVGILHSQRAKEMTHRFLSMATEERRNRRKSFIAAGICGDCETRSIPKGLFARCRTCADKKALRVANRRWRKKHGANNAKIQAE